MYKVYLYTFHSARFITVASFCQGTPGTQDGLYNLVIGNLTTCAKCVSITAPVAKYVLCSHTVTGRPNRLPEGRDSPSLCLPSASSRGLNSRHEGKGEGPHGPQEAAGRASEPETAR